MDLFLPICLEFGNCPYTWLEYGMSCYQFNADKKDYYSASTKCEQSGGHLLYIDSNVEQSLFNQVKDDFWIGKFVIESQDGGASVQGLYSACVFTPINSLSIYERLVWVT